MGIGASDSGFYALATSLSFNLPDCGVFGRLQSENSCMQIVFVVSFDKYYLLPCILRVLKRRS